MAIYSGTSGRRRGSVGNETYTITRGQNIVKAKVIEPTNPKTKAQQSQRAKFASAVKFYQFAQKNFFKFAFEDKTNKESDFNAYMRYNTNLGVIFPKDGSEPVERIKGEWPMIAPWALTRGRLASADADAVVYVIKAGDDRHNQIQYRFTPDYLFDEFEAPTTVGELSALMIEAGLVTDGDILTFVCFSQLAVIASGSPSIAIGFNNLNYFVWKQLKIDVSSTALLSSLDFTISATNNFVGTNKFGVSVMFDIPSEATTIDTLAACQAVIRSRKVSNGVEVSDATLILNDVAQEFYGKVTSPSWSEAYLETWNAQQGAILAGQG